MRLKVMRHRFFSPPQQKPLLMRIINYIKIKTPSHYECRKERTKVTIALVRFYFYYYVEFFFFFLLLFMESLSIFTSVFIFPSFTIFYLFVPPFRKTQMEKQGHNSMSRSTSQQHTESQDCGSKCVVAAFQVTLLGLHY